MSVLSFLTDCSSKAVLSTDEKNSINTSIGTLCKRITDWFGHAVTEQVRFGSSTRDTILPRKIDDKSDIDYMIVFGDDSAKPQTYLDRVKRFVENYYSSSEINQSHPTIVLSLNHIKFDLVPATAGYYQGSYRIPGPTTGYSEWISTNPNEFNVQLTNSNKQNGNLIKPLIRLMKYWNSHNSRIYDSYSLEQHIVGNSWYGNNLRDYLYNYVSRMTTEWSMAQWRKDKIQRAKDIVTAVAEYERQDMPVSAEKEIKKLLPQYW